LTKDTPIAQDDIDAAKLVLRKRVDDRVVRPKKDVTPSPECLDATMRDVAAPLSFMIKKVF
jgi:hypothetical protein